MPKFRYRVWAPAGYIVVTAKDKDEADEIAEENGPYDTDDVDYDPYTDGQEWEVRFEKKLKK